MDRKTHIFLFFLGSIGIFVFDQISKWWIVERFTAVGQLVVIPGFLNIVRVSNKGVAFGLFGGGESVVRHYALTGLSVAVLAGLLVYYWRFMDRNKASVLAIAFIVGGAMGNLVDRIRLGAVVDFIDVYVQTLHWPAFNVADSAICIGVGLFLLGNMMSSQKAGR